MQYFLHYNNIKHVPTKMPKEHLIYILSRLSLFDAKKQKYQRNSTDNYLNSLIYVWMIRNVHFIRKVLEQDNIVGGIG